MITATTIRSQPIRYLIQEKHLSLDNRFKITDDSGLTHYKGNSTFFAMGDKLSISDSNGNELIHIRQENFHLHLTYKIFSVFSNATDQEIASIKRTGSMRQHRLEITSTNGTYIMQRKQDATSNEFTLTKNDKVVAFATRDISPTKTLYWVDIIDDKGEDHTFVLAVVIVLSCAQRLPGNPMAKSNDDGSESD